MSRESMKVGIIGKGHVGKAIGEGLKRAGHEVRYGHRDARENARDAAVWGESIVLAVPYPALKDVANEIAPVVKGKAIIDCTNPISPKGGLATGPETSAAEEVQRLLPEGKVVKAFNYVFASNMSTGTIGSERLTLFLAGDDGNAKEVAKKLASDIGFDPVDTGPLSSARYLEAMAMLLIDLGYGQKMGTKVGFRLVKG